MGRNTLNGLTVSHAMRRQVIRVQTQESIDCCIQYLIKYKVNTILVGKEGEIPVGVVSKTDIMGAWYAGLPLSTPVETIMISPPLFCGPDDSLDSALNTMKARGVYQIYAMTADSNQVTGSLAYPDMVGLLYHCCSACAQGIFSKGKQPVRDQVKRYKVHEIMTRQVESCQVDDPLERVVEILSASNVGAILVADDHQYPQGVISKTDMILSYRHGQALTVPAKTIMSSPVALCNEQDPVETAIKSMMLNDLHRLFVIPEYNGPVSGVISLTDAADLRSGSCRACISSRIKLAKN